MSFTSHPTVKPFSQLNAVNVKVCLVYLNCCVTIAYTSSLSSLDVWSQSHSLSWLVGSWIIRQFLDGLRLHVPPESSPLPYIWSRARASVLNSTVEIALVTHYTTDSFEVLAPPCVFQSYNCALIAEVVERMASRTDQRGKTKSRAVYLFFASRVDTGPVSSHVNQGG